MNAQLLDPLKIYSIPFMKFCQMSIFSSKTRKAKNAPNYEDQNPPLPPHTHKESTKIKVSKLCMAWSQAYKRHSIWLCSKSQHIVHAQKNQTNMYKQRIYLNIIHCKHFHLENSIVPSCVHMTSLRSIRLLVNSFFISFYNHAIL